MLKNVHYWVTLVLHIESMQVERKDCFRESGSNFTFCGLVTVKGGCRLILSRTAAAEPGIAADRFEHEIGAILKLSPSARGG
jgi:hypothetical protein